MRPWNQGGLPVCTCQQTTPGVLIFQLDLNCWDSILRGEVYHLTPLTQLVQSEVRAACGMMTLWASWLLSGAWQGRLMHADRLTVLTCPASASTYKRQAPLYSQLFHKANIQQAL